MIFFITFYLEYIWENTSVEVTSCNGPFTIFSLGLIVFFALFQFSGISELAHISPGKMKQQFQQNKSLFWVHSRLLTTQLSVSARSPQTLKERGDAIAFNPLKVSWQSNSFQLSIGISPFLQRNRKPVWAALPKDSLTLTLPRARHCLRRL